MAKRGAPDDEDESCDSLFTGTVLLPHGLSRIAVVGDKIFGGGSVCPPASFPFLQYVLRSVRARRRVEFGEDPITKEFQQFEIEFR